MIIAITGTPGTGKTSVSTILSKKYNIETINLHTFAKKENIIQAIDKKRKSDIIDINLLNKKLNKLIDDKTIVLLDGHLSHLLNCVSTVIVLRCHPIHLKNRLEQKQWSKEKIQENIQAEILDIILIEALEKHHTQQVYEIDTTYVSIDKTSQIIYQMLSTKFSDTKHYKPGSIDWSELLLSDEFDWMGREHGT